MKCTQYNFPTRRYCYSTANGNRRQERSYILIFHILGTRQPASFLKLTFSPSKKSHLNIHFQRLSSPSTTRGDNRSLDSSGTTKYTYTAAGPAFDRGWPLRQRYCDQHYNGII